MFAHNVHPDDAELAMLAEHGASVAHCPTSNCALGSGLFPLRRHVEHGIHVALGSDVGAGAGLFLPKEALQAYFIQQLLGPDGLSADPGPPALPGHPGRARRRWAWTTGSATSRVGKDFDAVWLRPADGSTLAVNLAPRARHHRRAGPGLRPGHPGGRGRGLDPGAQAPVPIGLRRPRPPQGGPAGLRSTRSAARDGGCR